MDKKGQISSLYKKIYGSKIVSLDYGNDPKRLVNSEKRWDKCEKCKGSCGSYENRQDVPYFKSFDRIKTMVIAESPGSGREPGEMGYVFGWEYFDNNPKGKILFYKNFFFKTLNLNEEETYITDAIKCYTPKKEFSTAFRNCNGYLEEEISILRPEKIIVVSKQGPLSKFLKKIKEKYSFELIIIPHPSNNIAKIKTVHEIFEKVGELNGKEDWIALGKQIKAEYDKLQGQLTNK